MKILQSGLQFIRLVVGVALALSGIVLSAQDYEPPIHDQSPAVQQHLDLAFFALNGAVSKMHLKVMMNGIPQGGASGPRGPMKMPTLPATKVFDQLYYLGHSDVSSWALATSDGIVLFDTLHSAEEAKTYIEDGLRSLKLDPAQIRYIIVTHGHPDHFGGSKYLQEKYHPHVIMSATDWESAKQFGTRNPEAGLATRDMVASDGETLTVGDTKIRIYVTPGHAPGALSTIFPVTDNGHPHVVSFFGGYGLQFIDRDPSKGGYAVMRGSLLRFAKLSLDAGADIILADHSFNDDSDTKVAAVNNGTNGGRNPWVDSVETVQRFYVATIEVVTAVETYFAGHPASGNQMQAVGGS